MLLFCESRVVIAVNEICYGRKHCIENVSGHLHFLCAELHGAESFFEADSCPINCLELEGSLPYSQLPGTRLAHEPVQSIPLLRTLLFKIIATIKFRFR
jgi:hypothetical protein